MSTVPERLVMHSMFKPGRRITTAAGREYAVEGYVARDGWAEFYAVAAGRVKLALKWYPEAKMIPKGERERVSALLKIPAPSSALAWPVDDVSEGHGWGHLMRGISDRFLPAPHVIFLQVETSFRALLRAGVDLSKVFRDLHAQALCWRDLNMGHLAVDPENGEIMVLNCGDLLASGEKTGPRFPLFAPPEAWSDGAISSYTSDLHGLAVFLFLLLVHNHPMIGREELAFSSTSAGQLECLIRPLFIFHPHDHANQPSPDHHRAALLFWPCLPSSLRALFTRAFTTGLEHPEARPPESDWQEALLQARDSIIVCEHCRTESFYDVEQVRRAGGVPPDCVQCRRRLRLPPRMRIDGNNCRIAVLASETELYPRHTAGRPLDCSRATARVAGEPAALLNLSEKAWIAKTPDNDQRQVPHGQSVILTNGMMLDFGEAKGEVRV
jgi:eukaryotic-like serine/threonine-protein kinase